MKKVTLAIVIVILASMAVAASTSYTLTPWPYGVIAWVQTPPANQQQLIDQATEAAGDVFSFWDLPVPVPAPDWAAPTQTDSQVYNAAQLNMIMQTPSLFFARILGLTQSPSQAIQETNPFLSPWEAEQPIAFPERDKQHLMLIPYPMWSGWKIMPLTIGIFPSEESLNRLFRDYTFSASFGGVGRSTLMRLEETGPQDKYELLRIFSYRASIIMSTESNTRHILSHELSHWAACLWCQENGTDLFSLPRLIIEGFADYTADSLTHDDSWRTIAASWAQQGEDFANVPWPLAYEVGTSIVNLLVQQKGKDGLLEMLADPAVNWEKVISSLTPVWRASFADVQLSAEDSPMYTAALQDLFLCRRMLAPVLPQEADDIVQRLYDECGTMADIDRFWELVSQLPPDPSEETWQALIARIPSFLIVQYRDSDPAIRMVRARVQIKLNKYAEKRDWKSFYETFIEGLRAVVAHYGFQEVTDTAQ